MGEGGKGGQGEGISPFGGGGGFGGCSALFGGVLLGDGRTSTEREGGGCFRF